MQKTIYTKMIGEKVFNLKIKNICIMKKNKTGANIYGFVCDCDCGEKNIIKNCCSIKRGLTKSCNRCCRSSHYASITGKNSKNYTGYEEISGKIWAVIKQGAKLRNHEFKLDIKDAWELFIKQDRKCALTKLDISFPKRTRTTKWSSYTASLDRIDSSKGYVLNNVQWVHKDVNLMKQQYTNEYFIYMCNLIAKITPINTNDTFDSLRGNRFGKKIID